MSQSLFAATGLAVCIALAVHMVLPYRARIRVDAWVSGLRAMVSGLLTRFTRWRNQRRNSRTAAQEAERAIRRARESALHDVRDSRVDGAWSGNVYRPKSFEKPRKPH